MMRGKWTLLFIAGVMFLAACSDTGTVGGVETVTVTLAADVAEVAAIGGSVTLTATIKGEGVTSVEFAEIDQATALAIDDVADDGYTAILEVTPPKTYLAVAKNAEGAAIGTSDTVTVAATGTTPEPPVPGPTPPTPPGPTPPTPPAPGGPIPADAVLATTPDEVNAAPAGATIVLTQDLTCAVDPCITLKENQKLLGGKDGQLLTTPGIKITTSIPTDTLTKSTVVRLANGTSVEGIDFAGDDIYQAINAPTEVTGTVTVRNVAISTPTANNPIDMKSTGALTLENLTFTTTRSVLLEGFSSATLRGLQLTINRPPTSVGAAFTIISGQESTVILEGLKLTTSPGGTNKDGVLVQSGVLTTDTGAMTVTVKDSTVTFPAADLATSIAFNFNVVGTGLMTIQEPESTGNTTNSTYIFKATYDTGVTGKIALP
jgi:hypothetical protein